MVNPSHVKLLQKDIRTKFRRIQNHMVNPSHLDNVAASALSVGSERREYMTGRPSPQGPPHLGSWSSGDTRIQVQGTKLARERFHNDEEEGGGGGEIIGIRVRFHIIGNARIKKVGKSQSCMVSK